MCSQCAEVWSSRVFPGSDFPEAVADSAVGMGDLMAALRENARNFANRFGEIDGMIQNTVRDVAEDVREMRRDMVSMEDFRRLERRIRELEGEAEESSDDGDFNGHTGYTDSEGDEEMSD